MTQLPFLHRAFLPISIYEVLLPIEKQKRDTRDVIIALFHHIQKRMIYLHFNRHKFFHTLNQSQISKLSCGLNETNKILVTYNIYQNINKGAH